MWMVLTELRGRFPSVRARLSLNPMRLLAVPLKSALRRTRQLLRGLLLVLREPTDLPQNLSRLAQCVWHVCLRQKTLLVIERHGGVGDLVCLMAAISGLRIQHPDAWLVVVTPTGCWRLALSTGLCDSAADINRVFHRLIRKVVAPQFYMVPRLPDEQTPPTPQTLHLAEEFARAVSVNTDFLSVNFKAPKRVKRRIARRLQIVNPLKLPIIVLHPGPSWPVREWPSDRWRELGTKILSEKSAVMIKIGTDLDGERLVRRAASIPAACDWVNTLEVIEFVALLEQASAFVGIDSGPLHIATAMGVPSVALFGPTNGRLRVHPRAKTILVTGVVSCLGCHHAFPAHLHWKTGCPNNIACMQDITPDHVLDAVYECLHTKRTIGRP
jgi:ADP-heptose:LPS heptosyltransferase